MAYQVCQYHNKVYIRDNNNITSLLLKAIKCILMVAVFIALMICMNLGYSFLHSVFANSESPTHSDKSNQLSSQETLESFSESLQPINFQIISPNYVLIDPYYVSPSQHMSDEIYNDKHEDKDSIDLMQSWHVVNISKGDSLATIFSQLQLHRQELHHIMSLGQEVKRLNNINVGESIYFKINDNNLMALKYEIDLGSSLLIEKQQDDSFVANIVTEELVRVKNHAEAVIESSLYMAAKQAGLTDKLTMQLIDIYAWDIDFSLDIRQGDSFTLIYEEIYKQGKKVSEGDILFVEFHNHNRKLQALRYEHQGIVDYYNEHGQLLRKAFLRTPVKFSRISSYFNLARKHPILNTIRAHRGVDYAAPTNTPVRATGAGNVHFKGNKGGYGRTIILTHDKRHSTLYAHLSKYAKSIRKGSAVQQGQIIGYVGKSGMATGPHLHYEFRLNGKHKNPLTIKLPKSIKIAGQELAQFKQMILPILEEAKQIWSSDILAARKVDTGEDG